MDMHLNDGNSVNICRVCLKTTKEDLNLNSGEPSYRIKLHSCVPIMDLDIVETSFLCAICAAEVDTSYSLRKKCLNTEEKLKDYLKQNCILRIENLQWISLLEVASENKLEWPDIDGVDSLQVKLEDLYNFQFRFDTDNYESKIIYSQDSALPRAKKLSSVSTRKKKKKRDLECHQSTNNAQYVCVCKKRFKTQKSYTKHLKELKEHQCEECGKVFHYGRTFNAHLKTHSNSVDFLCSICGISFNLKWKLKSHMRKHSDEVTKNKNTDVGNPIDEIFSCAICQRHFPKHKYLFKHLKIHGTKKFVCDVCKKQFTASGDLGKHRRVHTGEKPYECKICGMRFRLAVLLTRHIRSHTGEKPYVCEMCGKRFNQRYNLKSHTRIHTGEKPYECDSCAKRFSYKVTLDSHIVKVHAGGELFKCEICFKCFNNHKTLSNHRGTHSVTETTKETL